MKKVIDRASSRGYFNHGWLKTHHTFSFANYYNPERIHFGALRVLNDDSVDPSMGFDTHPHKNMEVISIPLKGYLRHGDSVQNTKTITPGDIQVMSTGSGIYHSEYNDSKEKQFLCLFSPRYKIFYCVLSIGIFANMGIPPNREYETRI
jgi:redox-sensitive bicupin YhaK (pirin superfamily)